MSVIPVPVVAISDAPGHANNGPYLDKIQVPIITQDDLQALALQSNVIDLIGNSLHPDFFDALSEATNIEIVQTPRNGYSYLTINTLKNPFNYTSFRRALAFAIDKKAISEEVWSNFSNPQDSFVPSANPYSVEGLLSYSYYEANVELGNQLLNESGFSISNETGFRTDPHGNPFSVSLEVLKSSDIAIETCEKVMDAFNALHIEAVLELPSFSQYLTRLYKHGDYDIAFLSRSFNSWHVNWLIYNFWSYFADVPGLNYPNFSNESLDIWIDHLLHSLDYDEVYEAAIEIQKILVYECPEIVLFENVFLSAYRTDRLEGFVNDANTGIPCWWTYQRAHLKATKGGPFGGTLRTSIPLDVLGFNFMTAIADYPLNGMLYMMYDSLLKPSSDGIDIPWLAESFEVTTHSDDSTVPEGHTRIVFDIRRNATWSDGIPITANDVAFTINYYRDMPGSPYRPSLMNMSQAVALTNYRVRFEFNTESFWHLQSIAYKPIIPKHIFLEIGLEGWDEWNPNPPAEEMVTSGPFNISAYEAGGLLEFTFNPNYFFDIRPDGYETTSPTNPSNPQLGSDALAALQVGIVVAVIVVIVGIYSLHKRQYSH
jgi:ABC-type transport system substrate-binding protein